MRAHDSRALRADPRAGINGPADSTGHRSESAFPALLTLEELSLALRVNPRTIRRMVAARRIPCVRLGRRLRFVPGDVFRWLEARKEG
jgi:excisionase family DNA binding protein